MAAADWLVTQFLCDGMSRCSSRSRSRERKATMLEAQRRKPEHFHALLSRSASNENPRMIAAVVDVPAQFREFRDVKFTGLGSWGRLQAALERSVSEDMAFLGRHYHRRYKTALARVPMEKTTLHLASISRFHEPLPHLK